MIPHALRSLHVLVVLTSIVATVAMGSARASAQALPTTVDPGLPRDPVVVPVERGAIFDPLLASQCTSGHRLYDSLLLDPGIPVEGDGLGRAVFTRDGSRVLVTNMLTDNVTVYDVATMQVLANVQVGDLPYGIAVTDAYAVVACPFSDAAYVIRLSDFTVAAVIETAERPWIVRTSADGRFAYVSTELGDTCEKIDLVTLTKTLVIHSFPMELMSYTANSENSRFWPNFLAFEVTPDGGHVVTGDWNDSILFFDTTTGALDHTLTGIPNCASVALSGNGLRAVGMGVYPFALYQIDLATFTRTDVVTPNLPLGTCYDMAVNADGSKVFVSLGDNRTAIVRFPTHNFTTFTQTLSAFWIGASPDHNYAVSGQTYFSIVSFLTDSVVGQRIGDTQISGAVSPVAARVAAFDPNRSEAVFFYEFSTPAAPTYRGKTPAGEPPEGDAPRRVAITPDGSKAVVTDVLSANVTIVDLATNTLEALVPVGEHPREVAITSDSRWAAISSSSPGKLSILDLATNQVVANVACGDGPAVVRIAPGDATAYVADIAQNKVFVVALDGEASHLVTQIPVGEIGSVILAGSVDSDIQVSPDGDELLVAVSFEDRVRVIDTATNSIVAVISVGDFPLQIAFDASGDHASVTDYLGNTVTTMRIAGALSSRIDTAGRGEGPFRIEHNPVLGETGIGSLWSDAVYHIDPATGALLHTDDYSAWGHVLEVLFDQQGEPVVLVAPDSGPSLLLRGSDVVEMPGPSAYFDYCPATQTAVATCSAPDYVIVVHWDTTGAPDVVTIPMDGTGSLESPHPNPVTAGGARIGFTLASAGRVDLDLLDLAGRVAAHLARGTYPAGRHEAGVTTEGLAQGAYAAVLRVDGRTIASTKVTIAGR